MRRCVLRLLVYFCQLRVVYSQPITPEHGIVVIVCTVCLPYRPLSSKTGHLHTLLRLPIPGAADGFLPRVHPLALCAVYVLLHAAVDGEADFKEVQVRLVISAAPPCCMHFGRSTSVGEQLVVFVKCGVLVYANVDGVRGQCHE